MKAVILKLVSIIGLVACTCGAANSQIISVDKLDTLAYVPKAQWSLNVAAGLEMDRQQTTLVDATNFADATLQKMRELFIVSASNRFTYNGPDDILNSGYLHLRWRHNYKHQLHPEMYVQQQWDNKRGMVHRFVTGANLRYNFWHKRMWEMTFATGLMYENEQWDYTAVDTNKIPAFAPDIKNSFVKSNSYMKWEGKTSVNSSIAIALFYQARFNHFFEPRIALNVNWDIAVGKHLGIGFKYAGVYDVQPVVPIHHFYYTLSNNLVYKL
jgi:hypothetical protein